MCFVDEVCEPSVLLSVASSIETGLSRHDFDVMPQVLLVRRTAKGKD